MPPFLLGALFWKLQFAAWVDLDIELSARILAWGCHCVTSRGHTCDSWSTVIFRSPALDVPRTVWGRHKCFRTAVLNPRVTLDCAETTECHCQPRAPSAVLMGFLLSEMIWIKLRPKSVNCDRIMNWLAYVLVSSVLPSCVCEEVGGCVVVVVAVVCVHVPIGWVGVHACGGCVWGEPKVNISCHHQLLSTWPVSSRHPFVSIPITEITNLLPSFLHGTEDLNTGPHI